MANVIVILLVSISVGSAIRFIWKEKKKGTRCIGCPSAGYCSRKECEGKHDT